MSYGADMIRLRHCPECGSWPYFHTPECSVTAWRERTSREIAQALADLDEVKSASPAPSVSPTDTTDRVAHSTNPVEMRARGER